MDEISFLLPEKALCHSMNFSAEKKKKKNVLESEIFFNIFHHFSINNLL